jgi:hypothetical protein
MTGDLERGSDRFADHPIRAPNNKMFFRHSRFQRVRLARTL